MTQDHSAVPATEPPLWESHATDEEIAEAILADLNYKRMRYERALIVTAHHVKRIREAGRRDATADA